LKTHPILTNKPVEVEWEFNARAGSSKYWINGRIDAVFYNKDKNKYIIADWKTGQNISKNPEKSFQTKLYLYSFFKAKNALKIEMDYGDLSFVYIKTPDLEEIEPVVYSKEKEREYEDEFLKIIGQINTADYYPKVSDSPSQACRYCPYSLLCFK